MSNLAQTQLSALGYGPTDTVFFRAIGPNGARNLDGTLVHQFDELQTLNSAGYGIYFVVNDGGHTDSNVKTGRAIFYEHDNLDKPIQIDLWQTLGLPEPTIQIDTGGKSIHSYWTFDQPISIAQWRILQTDLLNFAAADRSIKNPSRVMRLAGFTHQKSGGESVIISNSGKRYSFEELRSVVTVVEPIAVPAPKSSLKPSQPAYIGMDEIPLIKCIAPKHRDLIASGMGEGGRDNTGIAVAKDLIGTEQHLRSIGQRSDGDARSLFDDYCNRCNPPLTGKDVDRIWNSAEKSTNGPCLSEDKIQGCIDAHFKRGQSKTAAAAAPQGDRPIQPLTAETFDGWDLTDVPDNEIGSKTMRAMRAVNRAVGEHLKLNELTNQIEFFGKVLDPNTYKLFVAKLVDIDRPEADCTMILSAIAKKYAYHPVKIWLEKLHQTHGASTIDYLDRPASQYLHTENPLYDRLLRTQLIAAVKRIFEPGCKFDNAVVLQGQQGIGKSTFWNTIASDDWFDDNLGADVENKDSLMVLHGCWIEEWGEIDRITGKKELGAVKSFLSRKVDTFRAPYERTAVRHPRRGVIVGSVNPDEFLRDDENRRLWVIPVTERIDIEAVSRDRDAIWAAAVELYKIGTPINLSSDDENLLRDSNTQFSVPDPWEDTIESWVNSRANTIVKPGENLEWVIVDDLYTQCLGITEVKNRTTIDKHRVTGVLRRSGFSPCKTTVRFPGYATPKRAWFRQIPTQIPIAPPSSEPSTSLVVPIPVVTPARQSNLGTWDDDDSTADIVENYEYFDNPDVIEMSDRQRAVIGVAA